MFNHCAASVHAISRSLVVVLCAWLLACVPTAAGPTVEATPGGDVITSDLASMPVDCGDGVCGGVETLANCAADCGFLRNRLAGPCTTPGQWAPCPGGYLCIERSPAGGGNVCVADFETWPPIADDHPNTDFKAIGNYVVDRKTGLWWSDDWAGVGDVIPYYAKSCTAVTSGGFVDWRAPTLAELQSLSQLGGNGWGSHFSNWYTRASASTANSNWLVNFDYDANSISEPSAKWHTNETICVRGGESDGSGSGSRFGHQDFGATVLDRLSGLTWRKSPSPPMESDRLAAQAWCADLNSAEADGQKPAQWRLPTLGELRQLAARDPKAQSEATLPFDEGTYFIASTPAPKGWESYAWHILYPQGGTDHGPDWVNKAPTALPWVRVACVR
jgi:hypothetical protein